jgi:hypothetical protein
MVTYQTTAEQDVSRRLKDKLEAVPEKEKSTLLTDPDVPHVTHIRELKDKTLSASLINAVPTKSSHG